MLKTLQLFRRRKERTRLSIKKLNKGKRVRFSVYRSNNHIYAQIIDDFNSITLVSASTVDKEIKGTIEKTSDVEAAKKVGSLIAQRAKDANITQVVFDKGGYIYHGRVKALAEAARFGGLEF
jgi:large subunit ribosomal protein L18